MSERDTGGPAFPAQLRGPNLTEWTERVHYWQCERCGATMEMEAGDYHDDYGPDDYVL